MWAKWAKIGSEIRFFCHFLWFGSLVSLKIAYTEGLQLDITSSRGKTHKKNWGSNLGQNGPKSGPKLRFLSFSQVCLTTSRGKTCQKKLGGTNLGKTGQYRV